MNESIALWIGGIVFVNSISEQSSIDLDSVETITAQYLKEQDKIILDVDSEMRTI